MKTFNRILKDYDKNIIFNIYLGRKEIVLIFFRHFVERPATIFTCSTIIGLRLRH